MSKHFLFVNNPFNFHAKPYRSVRLEPRYEIFRTGHETNDRTLEKKENYMFLVVGMTA